MTHINGFDFDYDYVRGRIFMTSSTAMAFSRSPIPKLSQRLNLVLSEPYIAFRA